MYVIENALNIVVWHWYQIFLVFSILKLNGLIDSTPNLTKEAKKASLLVTVASSKLMVHVELLISLSIFTLEPMFMLMVQVLMVVGGLVLVTCFGATCN